MKVFISWSGPLSKQLGEAIRDWLPSVLQFVVPYFTPSDVEKGGRWSTEISKELENSQIGILCVTRDNLHSDWILFEAGALSKSLQKSYVCPILFDIGNTDLAGPMKQFQTTEFEKKDFLKLLSVINGQSEDRKLPSKTLEKVFEKWWPDLDSKIKEILSDGDEPKPPLRSERELLEEILQLSRVSSQQKFRPSINPKALESLLKYYLELHDQQVNKLGDYQETLDSLKKMHKAIKHIVTRYEGLEEELDDLIEHFKCLSYCVAEKGEDSEGSDIPF